jgi:hypothetical protein
MNIDKFGHHVHKRLRVSEVSELKYKALLRTEAGHFDLQSLRLKGVVEPLSPDDAVNKQYVDKYIQNTYEKKYLDSMFDTINGQILHLASQLKLNFYTNKEIDRILKNKYNDKRANSERDSSISEKEL